MYDCPAVCRMNHDLGWSRGIVTKYSSAVRADLEIHFFNA